ncbi:MAG: GNAT family N-acetyltransferase [Chlorobiaceae bacterium]|nr:GNAT family N-acetyltransferase [Chlorobiaceae bacterium]
MKKIDTRELLNSKSNFVSKLPIFLQNITIKLFRKFIHEEEINNFLSLNSSKKEIEFIDELFEYLDFSYSTSQKEKDRIPGQGKLVVIANHPLGGLDGLVLLKLISEVRSDVKIVVNDLLLNIENLKNLFLPYDIMNSKLQKENLINISEHLKNEGALIIFPAGIVSRLKYFYLRDSKWQKGALFFAAKYDATILPVYIKAKNSNLFYLVSMFSKKLSMILLPHELFNKRSKTIQLKIGHPVPFKSLSNSISNKNIQLSLLQKHLRLVGKGKKGIFKTEKTIIHPIDKKIIKKEFDNSELLDKTIDDKKIYLVKHSDAPNILKEISRLREITFRQVGEGTGKKQDSDQHDQFYHHIVLWDDKELEIVGSYRIGLSKDIIDNYGCGGLYTSSLFSFDENFQKLLPYSIELGRSFIQSRYWRSNALDSLWQGIGIFLSQNPSIKFLFGPVSLSVNYSDDARYSIIYFYQKWFSNYNYNINAKNKFSIPHNKLEELKFVFNSDDQKEDYRALNQ